MQATWIRFLNYILYIHIVHDFDFDLDLLSLWDDSRFEIACAGTSGIMIISLSLNYTITTMLNGLNQMKGFEQSNWSQIMDGLDLFISFRQNL